MLRGLSMTTGTFVIIVALLTASASIPKQWELIWKDYKPFRSYIPFLYTRANLGLWKGHGQERGKKFHVFRIERAILRSLTG